jgi:RNA polymerase sigma-70 factor, ECF subfamily
MTVAAITLPGPCASGDGIIEKYLTRLICFIGNALLRPLISSGVRENVYQEQAIAATGEQISRTGDTGFVRLSKSGDRRAFEELVYRYQDMIFSLCVRMLGNRADGEDAAQETFVKAYEAMQGFKGDAAFSTWLYRIAVNVCKNITSSFWTGLSRKAIRLDKPVEDEEGGSQDRDLPSNGLTPDQVLERRRSAKNVRAAIAKLPEKHREIIVLADIQELSNEEIRVITGLNEGTIKSRLNRGREALKRLLEKRELNS